MLRKYPRITSLIIAATLATSFLVSCGENKNVGYDEPDSSHEADNSGASGAGISMPSDAYTTDFGGYEFRILAYNNMYEEFDAEEMNGDALNDAVFKRNQLVEEKLGIKIKVENLPDAEYNEMLVKNTNAGEDAYDLYQTYISRGATYAKNGYFLDWRTVDYVKDNLDREWWNQGGLRELSFHNKVYLLNGDISYLTLGNTTALLFNKKVFDDKGIEYPYESVLDGAWTLDALLSLCVGQNQDLNGDGRISIDDDYYSFMTTRWLAPVGFPISCGLERIKYDNDGKPILNFMTERTVDVYDKLYKLTIGNDSNLQEFAADVNASVPYTLFMENRLGITPATLDIASKLRNMESDFGIIPYPKYDEKQENYISSIDAGTSTSAISVTSSNPARTGMIVETLAEMSVDTITPIYYEKVLKGKSTRDEESERMLDIIKDTSTFDHLYVMNYGNLGFAMMNWLATGKTSITSEYAAVESKALEDIDKVWSEMSE